MSALKKLNEAEVSSAEGFTVKYGRDTLTYSEGGRSVIVPIEHLGQPYELAVYLDLASVWTVKGRPEGEISSVELDILERKIRECLTFLHRNFSVRR